MKKDEKKAKKSLTKKYNGVNIIKLPKLDGIKNTDHQSELLNFSAEISENCFSLDY